MVTDERAKLITAAFEAVIRSCVTLGISAAATTSDALIPVSAFATEMPLTPREPRTSAAVIRAVENLSNLNVGIVLIG